jgi:hypothetical protein
VAEGQRQWAQAREHFLRALETFVTYDDSHSAGIVLRSLARLWKVSGDASLRWPSLPSWAPVLRCGGQVARRGARRWSADEGRRLRRGRLTGEGSSGDAWPGHVAPVPRHLVPEGVRGSPRSRQRGRTEARAVPGLAPRPPPWADDASSSRVDLRPGGASVNSQGSRPRRLTGAPPGRSCRRAILQRSGLSTRPLRSFG